MNRQTDTTVRQILRTAAFAIALPTAASSAAATAGRQEATDATPLFPLKLAPKIGSTEEDVAEPISVRVLDAEGRCVLNARTHGKCTVGPLPAGEYRVQLQAGSFAEEHALRLGSGRRGLLRYHLGA
ncbi:MAG: hypothetical protein KDH17_04100 [Rhodocyclaceae bacterium]|nr:hypothetical protein [Rhodocyclaceae bacterium]MCB1927203.1 hypothetical protein [Rhodocyclaceae bacterium]MCP5237003.1 hypothetical protein [Zoogloeaceae bacterium]